MSRMLARTSRRWEGFFLTSQFPFERPVQDGGQERVEFRRRLRLHPLQRIQLGHDPALVGDRSPRLTLQPVGTM